jgi:hypothetical protein
MSQKSSLLQIAKSDSLALIPDSDLKCIFGAGGTSITGPLTIGGRIADRKAALRLPSKGGPISFDLPLSAN